MALLGIEPDRAAEVLPAVLLDWLGGDETAWTLNAHFGEGMTTRQIARMAGVSQVAIVSRINTARRKLRSVGLLPPAWESRASVEKAAG